MVTAIHECTDYITLFTEMDINKIVLYAVRFCTPLIGEAVKVGSCGRRQRSLLADQFVHDGQLSVPLLHLLQRSPRHVVLKFKSTNKRVRAARTPFLQKTTQEFDGKVIKIKTK